MEDKHDRILQSVVNMMYSDRINDTLVLQINGYGNTYYITSKGYDEYELRTDYENDESSFNSMFAEEKVK